MAYEIRPLTFSEILDRAFRVYLDNFVLLFGIDVVFMIPMRILLASGSVIGSRAATRLTLALALLAGPITNAALIASVAEVYLGRPTTIADAYRSVIPIALQYLGTFLLYLALITGIGVPIGIATVLLKFLPTLPRMVAYGALVIAGMAGGAWLTIRWCLHGSAVVIERRFGSSALRRSRELVAGAWWRTFGIVLAAFLLPNLPAAALRFLWGYIPVAGVILTAATQAASSAYSSVAMVIYYFDRRCRIEDFDLRLLAEQVRSEGS